MTSNPPPVLAAAGYLNVDLVANVAALPARDTRVTAGRIESMIGGMATNVACAAARLGPPWPLHVDLLAMAGQDDESRWTLAALEQRGITTRWTLCREGEGLTHCLILVEPDGRRAIVSEPVAFDLEIVARRLHHEDGTSRLLYVDGYRIPDALPLLQEAAGLGWETAIDLDGLPADWCTPAGLATLCDSVDLLFVNRQASAAIWPSVAAQTYPSLAGLAHAVRPALEGGKHAQALFLTLGDQGVLVLPRHDAAAHVAALPVAPVDTTGAGDVFAGVCLALWLHGAKAVEAARYASAAAALSTLGRGAQGALPTAAAVLGAGLPPVQVVAA